MAEERVWIRIAKDPLGRDLVNAVSLGVHGVAFANYAIDVPESWLDQIGDKAKYFDIVDEDDISEEEKRAAAHNRKRNDSFKEEARRNAQIRKRAREKAVQAQALAEALSQGLTEDFPDSDDD